MIHSISEDLLWSQLVAHAWCDETLMQRLRSNPRTVLAEHGMEVPEDMEVQVVEGAEVAIVQRQDSVRCFTFPLRPPDDLSDEDLVVSPLAGCFSAACVVCGACGACACRCVACRCAACRCF